MRSLAGKALACALVVLLAPPVRAQLGGYREIIAEAVPLLEAQRWSEAYVLFRRAHELQPSARTLRGMGMAAVGLEHYVEAIGLLEQSITDSRRPLTPELRADVERLLARARSVVGRVRVVTSVAAATATVDDVAIELDAPTMVDPGEHSLVLRAPGHLPETRTVTVDPGGEVTLELALRPISADRAQEDTPIVVEVSLETPPRVVDTRPEDARTSPSPGPSTTSDVGFVAVGAGSLVLSGLSLAGAIAAHAYREHNVGVYNESIVMGGCPELDVSTGEVPAGAQSGCFLIQERWRASEVWAGVGYGVAGLGIVLGVLLVVLAPQRSTTPRALFLCGNGPGDLGVACGGSF